MWTQSDPRRRGKYNKLKVKCFKCGKFGHFAKKCRSKIDHAHVSQEKCEKSQVGDSKDDNLSVVSEECAMIAQDRENMKEEENSTVIFDSVHLSHTQEFCKDLMEQELNLYWKMQNSVLYFVGNSEQRTMMMEQSIWCESSSSPTSQKDMLSDKTYKIQAIIVESWNRSQNQ